MAYSIAKLVYAISRGNVNIIGCIFFDAKRTAWMPNNFFLVEHFLQSQEAIASGQRYPEGWQQSTT
jgi:hypothetical protein